MVSKEGTNNQIAIRDIKRRLWTGEITYDEALAETKVICDRINAKAKEIAKNLGVRPRLVNPRAILR